MDTRRKKEYPYIRAWCYWLGYCPIVAVERVSQARAEGAPDQAVYYDEEAQRWVEHEDIVLLPELYELLAEIVDNPNFVYAGEGGAVPQGAVELAGT